ncbi:UvrY/SirA/GacA family response regulator transcription factor [Neptunicella marina]|uniref:UvrY/SirA/GacA family response regulator transcription factor n=1 Tax=Neptunicella marina TaxID=2125989 RepID=A0A8J6M2J8_9ALTE|nr:UvrY/SirA/GacA family response regulator transcription factor [Neptunicella marina]MBC3764466.1 UvrY/SirA/GacA family response regulator transcription factor [Neptunicella marina]
MASIKILLVDDHDLVRTGIRKILDDEANLKVVGEASTGEEAIKFCKDNPPDVVLMDMNMPGMGGLEALKRLIRLDLGTRLIVLSVVTDNPFPGKVMQMGADGYLTKNAPPAEMIKAIHHVYHGQKYISHELAQQIAIGQLSPSANDPFAQLSDREMQITLLITKGNKVPDIAAQLSLSAKTVNTYKYRLFEKLNVSGEVELTHLALRHKLIVMDTL